MNDVFKKKPLIYLITKGDITPENFRANSFKTLQIIGKAVEAKIPLIQIREKNLSAKLLFELASEAVKITRNSNTKLLINDRADIALAAKADGVHLAENSLSAEIVRENFPAKFIIGVSAHSLKKAEIAKRQGADFVAFSPIFSSPNKGKPFGLRALREVCLRLKPFPIIALGGIDETNYCKVLKVADGFASIRFLNDPGNLQKLGND
jgi:thiamine-phosphate pyrophosphorylase